MRDFVSYPTAGNERLHCTMKRTEDNPEVGGPCYTLYLEYLGGLVPILKGRRISKLRPEFVIMDPKTDGKAGEVILEILCEESVDGVCFENITLKSCSIMTVLTRTSRRFCCFGSWFSFSYDCFLLEKCEVSIFLLITVSYSNIICKSLLPSQSLLPCSSGTFPFI